MIDSATSVYGVFGDPVSHSLSPVMHNAAFADIGFNGIYLAFNVKNIEQAITGVKALEIKGVSITIPHKVAVMNYLDEVDETASRIGAVNTVVNHNGVLKGYNSDWIGAVNALSEKTGIRGKRAAIIGAGGAARAVGFGIRKAGGLVSIINRTGTKGEQLAKELDAEIIPLSEINRFKYDILINATPLGMTPNTDQSPVPKDVFHRNMIVMDTVYNPLKTRLLKEAEESGCITIDGLSMFVYQGAFQFESWTGKKAPVEVMRNAVLNSL